VAAADEEGEEGEEEEGGGGELGESHPVEEAGERRVVGAEEFESEARGAIGEGHGEEEFTADATGAKAVKTEGGEEDGGEGFEKLSGENGEGEGISRVDEAAVELVIPGEGVLGEADAEVWDGADFSPAAAGEEAAEATEGDGDHEGRGEEVCEEAEGEAGEESPGGTGGGAEDHGSDEDEGSVAFPHRGGSARFYEASDGGAKEGNEGDEGDEVIDFPEVDFLRSGEGAGEEPGGDEAEGDAEAVGGDGQRRPQVRVHE